jgi:hypothetical protein
MISKDSYLTTTRKLPLMQKINVREIGIVLAVCVIPIHFWSIYNTLRELPGWLMRMDLWDAIGAIAYTQVFALLESLILWAALVFLGLILPKRWFAKRFISQASSVVAVFSIWILARHYLFELYPTLNQGPRPFLIAIVTLSFLVPWFMIYRSTRLNVAIESIAGRLAVLGFVYLILDVASVLIILTRFV